MNAAIDQAAGLDNIDNANSAAARIAASVSPSRLLTNIAKLATFGARSDGGVDRQTLTQHDLDARAYLIDYARALGCDVYVDDFANLFFRRAGSEDLPPVMTGSHADTQPTGGKLDGCYGVLAALECIAALNDAGVRTRYPVEAVVWTNEEGTRFQPGAMGSSAFVDPSVMPRYRRATDARGVTLAQALDEHRQTFPALTPRAAAIPVHACVELHIEQGPQLELAGAPLGIVTGIQGVRWYNVTCTGSAAHAGTTPMAVRRDAMSLACALRAEIEAFASDLGRDDTRITFGRWSVTPNAINTIASEVVFSIDFRHPDPAVLDAFDRQLAACAVRHAAKLDALFAHAPVQFDDTVLAHVRGACNALSPRTHALTSGAFHDAMYLATHCPTAMLFVPSIGGISHNPAEATDDTDLVLGARALAHCVAALAQAY